MHKKLLIFISFLVSNLIWAQDNNFHFRHLSTTDGLSNSSVIALTQDRLGNMWLGTRNGLNKYNGDRFEVFKNNELDSTSLSNNDILSVLEDSDGFIWVGTYNGLNKYDPIKNKFTRYFHQGKNTLLNNVVICSKEMPNGEIWFGTGRGISIYNKITDSFINIEYDGNQSNGLPYRNIQRIFMDSSNQIWIATTQGLAKFVSRKGNDFAFKKYRKPKYSKEKKGLFIQDIIEINTNILAIGTKYNGLLLFNTIRNKYTKCDYKGLSGVEDVRVIELANDGNIWLGTVHGVKVITPEKKVYNLKNSRHDIASISRDFIKSIYKDKSGSLWLGTYSGGVNIWSESNENFINFRNNDIDNNVVTAIVSDKNSNLYIGTEGGTVSILDKNKNIIDVIKVADDDSKLNFPIQSLLISESNHLWVGVLNYGIFIYDLKTKKRISTYLSDQLKSYLKNTSVYTIKESPKNIFWIGTFGKGLVRYNNRIKIYRVFGSDIGKEPFLSTNIIKTVTIDEKQNIWAGGLGTLNLLTYHHGFKYTQSVFNIDASSGGNIRTIFEDSQKNIWVGTNSKGLKKFDGKNFTRVVLDSVSPVSTIYTVLENENGNLWMTTDKGIIEFNPSTYKTVIHHKTMLENSNEFSSNSGINLGKAQMLFGGGDGVTIVNPKKIVKNYYAPQVILSDFKIKNKSVKIDDDGVLSKSISHTKNITLSYDNSNFSISYAIPNFLDPKNNTYAYRLIGLDASWSYTKNTEVFYTLQTPGKYIFEVKGANNDGVWNDVTTRLVVKVTPAPWRSWWAFTLYGLLIASSLIGLYWIMQSRTKLQHSLELEHSEGEKVKEINKAKLQFFTNISHEFRTPLTLILGPLQQVLANYSGSNAMYKKLMVMESSANHLLRLINRLMDFRKLENHEANISTAEGNFVNFLNEIFLSFTEFAKGGNYEYSFSCSEEKILVYYDRYKLERVFYNLISNAFRYTPEGGKITISLEKLEKTILIKVSDSGVGIAEEHIDKIFDRFFEVPIHNSPERNYNQGTGIGLSIASNIVKLHHGKIGVENNKTKGAVFSVELLLGKEHLSEDEISKSYKKTDDVTQYISQLETPINPLVEEITDLKKTEKTYTLLLVEDNISLRSFMKELLKEEYNILEAENGKVALKLANKHLPDLIVSDVIMPEMVGTELCSKIKENIKTSHIPVILLTSRTSLVYKFEGLESGADDYISKPFNLKEFKLRISNLLELNRRLKDKFTNEDSHIPSDLAVTSIDEELLKKAFEVVEKNISNEDFDVTSFCSELNVSRSMLFTKIKAWTNSTPNEFIREIRLKKAAQLLEQNKINVSQVSYKVGFKRPKYFSKCFQKKYGMTPTEYIDKFSEDI